MARIRTINEAAAYMREQDEHTALTKTAIRRLVIAGAIPSVMAGQKYLINLDVLEEYLTTGAENKQLVQDEGIRRIEVRP